MQMPQVVMVQQRTKMFDKTILLDTFVRGQIFFKKFTQHGFCLQKSVI